MRHLTSRQNGSRYYALGEAVIAKGQKVRLNELGLRFYVSNKGVPKRGHPKWDGRIGIVAKLTRDKTRARIIWDGNRLSLTRFRSNFSRTLLSRSAPTNEANLQKTSPLTSQKQRSPGVQRRRRGPRKTGPPQGRDILFMTVNCSARNKRESL
jgi:hypothetical protein